MSAPVGPLARTIAALRAGTRLYAVVDGARDPELVPTLTRAGVPCASLFQGDLPPEVALTAPWLVDLEDGAASLAGWLLERWGRSLGVYALSPATFKAVRAHLRSLLVVTTEAGRELYFRFYDPRVLRDFLPTCTLDEQATLFGPITAFLVEDEEPSTLLRFAPGAEPLEPVEVSLRGEPAAAAPTTLGDEPAPDLDEDEDPALAALRSAAPAGLAALWAEALLAGPPPDTVAAAWSRAEARVPLARAALLRAPGRGPLLAFLGEVADQQPAAVGAAGTVRRALEAMARRGLPKDELRATLRAFPPGDPQLAFAALAPALQGAVPTPVRGALVARVAELAAAGRVQALRGELDAASGAADEAPRVQAVLGALAALAAEAAAIAAACPEASALEAALRRASTRLGMRRSVDARATSTALNLLLVSLGAHREEPVAPQEAAAAVALLAALRATEGRRAAELGASLSGSQLSASQLLGQELHVSRPTDPFADPALLAWLEDHYGSVTAARALWQWAGGRDDDVPVAPPGGTPWPALWARARDEVATPGLLSLVREALHDRPGEPFLLEWLHAVACAVAPAAAEAGPATVDALVELRAAGFPPEPLRGVLDALPVSRREHAFAALAPALDERLGHGARVALVRRCEALRGLGPLVGRLRELRDELRAVEAQATGDEAGREVMSQVVAPALAEAVRAAQALDDEDPAVVALRAGLARLERRFGLRRALPLRSGVTGLTSLLVEVGVSDDNPYDDASTAAAGLVDALFGTTADPAPDPLDPPDEPAPSVRFDGVPVTGPSAGVKVDEGRTEAEGQVDPPG